MAGTTSGVLITQNGDDVDITLFQGKTVNFTVTWGGTSPINITGYTARLQARKDISTPVIVEIVAEIGGANGVMTFTKSATQTAAFEVFEGVYDLELTTNAGAVHQVMSGKFKVSAEVTR